MAANDGARALWAAAFLALALLLCGGAQARTVLDLTQDKQPVPLLDWGDSWIDPTGEALVDNVATDARIPWIPTREHAIYPLNDSNALWIRFRVPPAPDRERWYLEIVYPAVNRVTLYTADSVGQWTPLSAGDELPVADWPVPHRHPVLPISVSAEVPRIYLLRVQNPHSFSAPLQFVSESYRNRSEQRVSLVLGMFFGLAALTGLLGVLSAVTLRDGAYALFALSVALMSLTQASITGVAGLHLWPEYGWWNDVSALGLPVLTVGAFLWFFAAVVSLAERSRVLNLLLLALAAASVPLFVAILLVPPSWRVLLMAPYVAGATTLGFIAIGWATRRGDRYGPWLLASSVPVMAGAAFVLMRASGAIPVSFWSMHAMQLGIAVQLPALLVILMLRSQQRRENNRRIQGLDRMDPATGLINAHVFSERLRRMMARSKRLRYQSAVLLVDIVNIEQVRRDFDRHAAEELPLRVAGHLLSAAREIDSVARLSEARFGVLVEGPLTPEEAASVGPRLVARCLMPFKNRPLEWVAQVRVAQTLVPSGSSDANLVVERLGALLAAVPADSKRAVFAMK